MADARTFRLAPSVLLQEVDECFVTFDPVTQQAMALNLTASDVVYLCDGTRTVDEVVDRIAAHHERAPDEVRATVLPLLEQLEQQGVLAR